MSKLKWIVFGIIGLLLFKGFFLDGNNGQQGDAVDLANADLVIVSGSENKELQPIIDAWADDEGKQVAVVYKGSVDIYRSLQQGNALRCRLARQPFVDRTG